MLTGYLDSVRPSGPAGHQADDKCHTVPDGGETRPRQHSNADRAARGDLHPLPPRRRQLPAAPATDTEHEVADSDVAGTGPREWLPAFPDRPCQKFLAGQCRQYVRTDADSDEACRS